MLEISRTTVDDSGRTILDVDCEKPPQKKPVTAAIGAPPQLA
jgi:hypothetical protein